LRKFNTQRYGKNIQLIYSAIGLIANLIYIKISLHLIEIKSMTSNEATFLIIDLILLVLIVYIIVFLVHFRNIFNLNIKYENNKYNEIVKHVNVMQKYFKFLHNYYHIKTDGKNIELRPTNIEINKNFTKEELEIIGYSEYDIEILRK